MSAAVATLGTSRQSLYSKLAMHTVEVLSWAGGLQDYLKAHRPGDPNVQLLDDAINYYYKGDGSSIIKSIGQMVREAPEALLEAMHTSFDAHRSMGLMLKEECEHSYSKEDIELLCGWLCDSFYTLKSALSKCFE